MLFRFEHLFTKFDRPITSFDLLSHTLYPQVFEDYHNFYDQYANVSVLDTPTFFYGMKLGEEIEVEIEQGKTLIIKLISISKPQKDGTRVVYFELNGQPREIVIKDHRIESELTTIPKADKANERHIGATMPGTVVEVICKKGEKVNKGDHLIITEAMKMETTVQAPFEGVIKNIFVKNSEPIAVNDLLIEFE